ncbi:MAG: hypothetical protein ACRCYY_21255 [Trueperaceae bacterium]
MVIFFMLIPYLTGTLLLFVVIIVVGLTLTIVHDKLEQFVKGNAEERKIPLTKTVRAPSVVLHTGYYALPPASTSRVTVSIQKYSPLTKSSKSTSQLGMARLDTLSTDTTRYTPKEYTAKVVRVNLTPQSRIALTKTTTKTGEKIGEHVTVFLPKAA